MATQLFVVPRSMPITSPVGPDLRGACARRPGKKTEPAQIWNRGMEQGHAMRQPRVRKDADHPARHSGRARRSEGRAEKRDRKGARGSLRGEPRRKRRECAMSKRAARPSRASLRSQCDLAASDHAARHRETPGSRTGPTETPRAQSADVSRVRVTASSSRSRATVCGPTYEKARWADAAAVRERSEVRWLMRREARSMVVLQEIGGAAEAARATRSSRGRNFLLPTALQSRDCPHHSKSARTPKRIKRAPPT